MSTLEREIMEKFHQLQPAAKRRIRTLIEQDIGAEGERTGFDYDAWFSTVETLRQQIHANHGDELPPLDVVETLRDIRDGEDE